MLQDATSGNANITSGNTSTHSHTCSGSDRLLVVAVSMATLTYPTVTSITYSGSNLTQIGTVQNTAGNRRTDLWYMVAPATGANNIVVTLSGNIDYFFSVAAASYTGAAQTGQPNVSGTANNTSKVTTTSKAITTTVDDCWTVAGICDGASTNPAALSGYVYRVSQHNRVSNGYELRIMDSDGSEGTAGSKTIGETHDLGWSGIVAAAFAPAAGGGTEPQRPQLIFW